MQERLGLYSRPHSGYMPAKVVPEVLPIPDIAARQAEAAEKIAAVKKEKKIDNQVYLNVIIKVNKKERRVFTMSVDVTKMPKLGFGLMRLPEKDGELDLEQLCKMVDAYMVRLNVQYS